MGLALQSTCPLVSGPLLPVSTFVLLEHSIVETEGSVTHWICELKDGDEGAAQQELFNRYFQRLTGLARTRLRNISRRAQDEEVVAMQALASFFEGVRVGNFPQLDDRTHLWPLDCGAGVPQCLWPAGATVVAA